jgi:hypothetical protein
LNQNPALPDAGLYEAVQYGRRATADRICNRSGFSVYSPSLPGLSLKTHGLTYSLKAQGLSKPVFARFASHRDLSWPARITVPCQYDRFSALKPLSPSGKTASAWNKNCYVLISRKNL